MRFGVDWDRSGAERPATRVWQAGRVDGLVAVWANGILSTVARHLGLPINFHCLMLHSEPIAQQRFDRPLHFIDVGTVTTVASPVTSYLAAPHRMAFDGVSGY